MDIDEQRDLQFEEEQPLSLSFVIAAVACTGLLLQYVNLPLFHAEIGATVVGILAYAARGDLAAVIRYLRLPRQPRFVFAISPLSAVACLTLTSVVVYVLSISAPVLAAHRVSSFIRAPVTETSARKLSAALDAAKDAGAHIDLQLIDTLTGRYAKGSQGSDPQWSTALKLASYASAQSSHPTGQFSLVTFHTRYVAPDYRADVAPPEAGTIGFVPQADAAVMKPFDGPDANADEKYGPAYVRIKGGSLLLDNRIYRHIIFEDAHVAWNGGPIKMEDVRFINCTFEFPPVPQGRHLLLAAISRIGTSFNSEDGNS